MKVRVKEKDFIVFIVFAIFLLYVCAFVVTNLRIFLDTDILNVTMSPFPAFSKDNISLTLLLFFCGLVGVFIGTSKSIFSTEKGKKLGFSFGEKEEKGYSRWSTIKEIKKYDKVEKVLVNQTEAKAAGVSIINNGKEMYVDNGENHTLVIGATASGKTTAVVDPLVNSLAKKGESMIITDPKGEIFKEHYNYLKSKGYNVIILNFRDPVYGNAWNPLTLPFQLYKAGNADKATELLDDVSTNILVDTTTKTEPFWERSAADYFAGICLGLFRDAEEKQINLNTVSYMATVGEEKLVTSNYIKEYFLLKGEDDPAYTFASNTINAPSETKGSILSVFRQKIRVFATKEDLSEMLSYTDFDIRNIGHEKTAVFMVIHDEKTTYHALATIFIKQCYETLVDSAYKEPNGKLPYRTNFILDEFANMPPLKDVTSMVTAARSRDIRFTFIIQNFAQLVKVYGHDDAETIKSNCGNLIYLLTTELAALEEISKLCGDVKAKGKDAEKLTSVPLVTVSDLQRLKMNEAIILKTRLNPFKTKLTPSYKIDFGHKFEKATFSLREKEPIQLFDLKEFVKNKKKAKLLDSMKDDNPSDDQKMMGQSFNPYPFDTQMPSFAPKNMGFGESTMNPMNMNPQNGQQVNLDDIVRQLDEQIAKLEKEEAEAKKTDNKPFIDNRDKFVQASQENLNLPLNSAPQPIIADAEKTTPDIKSAEPLSETSHSVEVTEAPIKEEPIVFTVQEPVIQETIIPTVEDIKKINDEVKEKISQPIVETEANVETNKINQPFNAPVIDDTKSINEEVKEQASQPIIDSIENKEPNNQLEAEVNAEINQFNQIAEPVNGPVIEAINASEVETAKVANIEKKETSPIIDSIENKKLDNQFETDVNAEIDRLNQIIDQVNQPVIEPAPITEDVKEVEEKVETPIINVDVDSVVVNNNLVSDDQFFDDFFADE